MDFDLLIPTQKYFLVVTLYEQTNSIFMKNLIILGSALVITGLSSCTLSQQFSGRASTDDVYWTRNGEDTKIQSLDDVNFDKQKDHKGGGTTNYEPSRNQQDQSNESERANDAYEAWNAKRGTNAVNSLDDQNTEHSFNQSGLEDKDVRRFGTERSIYYTDPYYNSLSNQWAWTSWYTPIIRPGFYNWAPGWNIGFGWNSNSGWGMGMGNNWAYGNMGWGNPYAYNPWVYDPWSPYYNPFYSPYAYNPWANNYGYNPWYGYNNCWNCYGHGWRNNCNTCWNSGRDIVQNTPRFIPRGEGIGRGSSGSRPGSVNTGGQQTRPSTPAMRNAPAQASDMPTRSGPNRNVRPNLDNAQSAPPVQTTRPGGDLIQGPGGVQTYVPPRTRTVPPAGTKAPEVGSTRPGGDLQTRPDGRTYYVPPRNTNYGGGSQNNAPSPSAPSDNGPSRPNYTPPSRGNSSPSYTPSPAPAPSRSGGGGSSSGGSSSGGGSRGSSGPVSRPR